MTVIPRVMIAGTNSGVGKTTLSVAVMAMLRKRGLKVQPFKVGPDYIDPGYHQAATGRISRNLDIFMLGEETLPELFTRSAGNADIAVIEGAMGLYDGIGAGEKGSSAHVARLLNCPVILIVDARSMAYSVAALVWGYANAPGAVPIAGVILNKVGSDRHYQILQEAIVTQTGIPVLGGFKRDEKLHVPERQMGLVPSREKEDAKQIIDLLGEKAAQVLNTAEMLNIAGSAPAILAQKKIFALSPQRPVRLGLVQDTAFNFYYQDGLDLLSYLGAELIPCSALTDEHLPPGLDGLYLGGGFPEKFMEQLSANDCFRMDLKNRVQNRMPLFAESGGFMYLCQSISIGGIHGSITYPGVGVVPARCRVAGKRMALGYVHATAMGQNILFNQGDSCRGHEFHYTAVEADHLKPAFYVEKTIGDGGHPEGHASLNVLATYLHLHFAGAVDAARKFLNACADFRASMGGK